MAKPKPPRGGLKSGLKKGAAPPEKITPKSFIGALPCLLIVLIGIGLLSLLFYASLSASLKNAPTPKPATQSTK
jgi:hypothetical protein